MGMYRGAAPGCLRRSANAAGAAVVQLILVLSLPPPDAMRGAAIASSSGRRGREDEGIDLVGDLRGSKEAGRFFHLFFDNRSNPVPAGRDAPTRKNWVESSRVGIGIL